MLFSFATILLISWAAVAALLYVFQPRFVYFPSRDLDVSPEDIGLEYESVHFTTTDDIRLHGWYVPAADSAATVLFFHGNAGNISHRLDTIRILNQIGLTVFIIDYRGYGLSAGVPSEKGTYKDAESAWRFLTQTRGAPSEQIIVFGRSLGGAIATWLAAEYHPKGLIVESSFTSVSALAKKYYPYLPASVLVRIRYPTIDRIGKVNCPVFVIHSPEDDIVPYPHGQRLFQAAKEPKQFLRITGGHNDGFLVSGTRYIEALMKFTRSASID